MGNGNPYITGLGGASRRAEILGQRDLSKLNAEIAEEIADLNDYVTPTGWTTATLAGSWTHQAGYPVQYRKIGDMVYWQGRANVTPASTGPVLTAPSGFRPLFDSQFSVPLIVAGPTWRAGPVNWLTTGAVSFLTDTALGVAFNGVSYSV